MKQILKYALMILILYIFPPIGVILFLIGGIKIYSNIYFKSESFLSIKDNLNNYVVECNELNDHIEQLRSISANIIHTDYGEAIYNNVGQYNYKRTKLSDAKYTPYVYDCSSSICNSARQQPFKYICKYFNINEDEESLNKFENMLNSFCAAEEGKNLMQDKLNNLDIELNKSIPWIIRIFSKKQLMENLNIKPFEINEIFYPTFSFRYISPGGKSGSQFDILMDIPMLERFIIYLSEKVNNKKEKQYQRKLMTPKLRKYIIQRDNFTCCKCGNSIYKEPNLLLEVDHIIPVSKGGLTEENNLQTLCWKCNRSKGSKIE